MITLFTIPRAFIGQFNIIQRNALKSWQALSPQIVLFGDEEGVKEIADEFSFLHIKQVKHNIYGTPLLSDAFQKIKKIAKFPLLGYLNCDIILLDDFIKAINSISLQKFLLIGQRRPLYIDKKLVELKDWQLTLKKMLKKQKSKPISGGSDYFVYPKKIDFPMPPFAVGRLYWDKWLIYYARSSSIPIINATQVITAIHQQHYQGFEKHGYGEINLGVEAQINFSYIGDKSKCLTIFDADYILTDSGLVRPKISLTRLIRRSEIAIIIIATRYSFLAPLANLIKLCRQMVTWLRIKLEVIRA